MFALILCLSAGLRPIITSSSDEKLHFVVNNSGPGSLMDDIGFLAERGGTVSIVGFLAGFDGEWAPRDIMRLMSKSAKLK